MRGELRAERISYGELAELQSLAKHIQPGDVELLEAAGIPEHTGTAPVASHTPTPWAVDWNMRYSRFQLRSLSQGSFGHFEGWSADGVTTEAEDKANAAFIIRACNSHAELLHACKAVVEAMKFAPILETDLKLPGSYAAWKACVDAIAKAERGQA